jgi:hypothetical protein
MATKKDNSFPEEVLQRYDRLIGTIPGLERKGAAIPYTSMNGHMFSNLDKDGSLVLRLPREAREEFLQKYNTSLHEAYGIIQKEYVDVPANVFANAKEIDPYFRSSYDYVMSLKPKPTRKPEKKGV